MDILIRVLWVEKRNVSKDCQTQTIILQIAHIESNSYSLGRAIAGCVETCFLKVLDCWGTILDQHRLLKQSLTPTPYLYDIGNLKCHTNC